MTYYVMLRMYLCWNLWRCVVVVSLAEKLVGVLCDILISTDELNCDIGTGDALWYAMFYDMFKL